jgi:hypothetical protein
MDLVQQEPDYQPMAMKDRAYEPRKLTPEEESALQNDGAVISDVDGDESGPIPVEEVW